jgi:CubicO group peptidase (beta-lactamase class C family)
MPSRRIDTTAPPRAAHLSRRTLGAVAGAALAATTLPGGRPRARSTAAQSATPTADEGSADLAAATDQFVRAALETYGVPGAAVAVVLDDQVVLARGYGVRKLGESGPVDEHTIFELGSNTKVFTAAALGTVVDQGALGWDDVVIDHLPEFALFDPYPTRYATVRDLLAHRTGLPAFIGDILGDLGIDRPEVLRRVRFIPPGSSFREVGAYSNIGFFVAGEVLARLTGATWEAAVQQRLLDPLGLTRTAPSAAVDQAGGNVAAAHAEVDGTLEPIPWYLQTVLAAAGGLTSTAADMAQWMRMLLAGGTLDGRQILRPETVQEMFQPSMVVAPSFSEMPPITDQSGFAYGLGCGVFHDRGVQVVEKGGALSGIRSVMELVPAGKLGVAVLSNRDLLPLPEAIRAFVLAQVLGGNDANDQAEIRQRGASLEALLQPTPPPANPGPPSLPLDGYVGPYDSSLYGQFVVVRDGDRLRIEAGSARFPGTLVHFGQDTYRLNWPPVDYGHQLLTFTVGPDGHATSFDTETLGRFERAANA